MTSPSRIFAVAINAVGSLCLAAVVLVICLVLLDTPKVDSFAAAHVKRSRYPNMDNVARDEDYSRYHLNSFGLVGDEPAVAGANSIFRIAVFGDSFVEAAQVAPAENFLGLLQASLRVPEQPHVEVWNFGAAGDNTGNALARWRYRPRDFQFKLAVFTFNDGDLYENSIEDDPRGLNAFLVKDAAGSFELDESHQPPAIDASEASLKRTFGRSFYAVFRIRTRANDWLAEHREKISRWTATLSGAQAEPAVPTRTVTHLRDPLLLAQNTYEQLTFVQDEFARQGIVCVLLGLPSSRISMPADKEYDPARRTAYLALTQRLREKNPYFVDMLPIVESKLATGMDPYGNWEPGGHFNRSGHQLVSAALTERLQEIILKQRDSQKDNAVQ